MELWYSLVDLLPFEWASYTFMKNALLAMLLITPLFGVLGTMAVDNKMAFFSDALGHSALTGIALGVVLGVSNQQVSMLAFGIVWALLITRIKQRNTASADTSVSVSRAGSPPVSRRMPRRYAVTRSMFSMTSCGRLKTY